MIIGYARVSTEDQSLDLQLKALKAAKCEKIYEDHGISGVRYDRPGLIAALSALQEGDTFVVWRLDRLARSMRDLTDTVDGLYKKGIHFRSICEYFDVSTSLGEFILHLLSAVAQFERSIIVERTVAGMAIAKEKGATFGRKPAIDCHMFEEALSLIRHGMSVEQTANQLGVGRSTLYRYIADLKSMPGYQDKSLLAV